MLNKFLTLTVLVLFSSFSLGNEPTNVILILADDLGWADTTLYGKTKLYETPNLERLAARGMTFKRAYSNSPLCSPTRASILTGQSVARHGSTAPNHHLAKVVLKPSVLPNGPRGNKALMTQTVTRLSTKLPTLGKLIKNAGYRTAHFGKWHLGAEPFSPLQHGFEVDIPHHPGPGPAGSFVAPWKFKNFKENSPGEHLEDRMADEAVKWIKTVKDKPFYMNYWQFSVHAPFDAKRSLIERYREKIKQKIDDNAPQRSPTYAAMVHSLDDAIGRLLDAVDQAGIADRTAFVFISDNGGNMYNKVDNTTPTSNAPLRGGKATIFEGGIRVPCIIAWPKLTSPKSVSSEIVQTADLYPTILNRLNIKLPAQHPVDGIDISPAFASNPLNREAIFTYFPHSPPVPDWLPPAVAVHQGDWKLIRLFHQGENESHRHLLFNLKNDIGEKVDLSKQHPEKVIAMDRLIAKHLDETKAVVPIPNPKFDPAKYQPEKEGVPRIRNQKNPNRRPAKKQNAKGKSASKTYSAGLPMIPNSAADANVRPAISDCGAIRT